MSFFSRFKVRCKFSVELRDKISQKESRVERPLKNKSKRFYQRTGGVLVGGAPCGSIKFVEEIIQGESVKQVANVLERSVNETTDVVVLSLIHI